MKKKKWLFIGFLIVFLSFSIGSLLMSSKGQILDNTIQTQIVLPQNQISMVGEMKTYFKEEMSQLLEKVDSLIILNDSLELGEQSNNRMLSDEHLTTIQEPDLKGVVMVDILFWVIDYQIIPNNELELGMDPELISTL